jgi:hypothetical protein
MAVIWRAIDGVPNRARFHHIGKARKGDRGCSGHIPRG